MLSLIAVEDFALMCFILWRLIFQPLMLSAELVLLIKTK